MFLMIGELKCKKNIIYFWMKQNLMHFDRTKNLIQTLDIKVFIQIKSPVFLRG